MMYRRGLERLKEQEGKVPHTVKSKNEFQGPSSNKTRVRTFRDNPKAIKHAQRIKMLQTFICPPLVVGSEGDLFSVRSLLDVAAKDKFTLELSETGEIRIYPSDSCAYFDIANVLLENDLPLRGLKQGGKSEFKAICVGLHQQENMSAIQEALGALGHDVVQISKPQGNNVFPPMLATFTITLERAENNWEIFNVTKLLGMKVTFRPPPRVLPPPKCTNCVQVGHLEYECGRRLCHSCDCSFIKGRNVIAKLAYEWPLTVKTRPKNPGEAKKKVKKGIKRLSDINREQEHANNESQETTNEAQEVAHESQETTNKAQKVAHESLEENIESQEGNIEKVEDVCRIEKSSLLLDEWLEKLNQSSRGKKYRRQVQNKIINKSFKSKVKKERASSTDEDDDNDDDDVNDDDVNDDVNEDDVSDDENKFNLMGYSSSDSSTPLSVTTTYASSTTSESIVFDDSSIPSDREPNTEEPEVLKKIIKEWFLDVTALEEQPSYSSSSSCTDSLNPLVIPKKKEKEEEKSKRPLIHEQEMLTCSFTHTRHSKPHEKAKENADPLGRSPIIKKKKVHSYTRSIGCGTYTRVNIVKERPQGVGTEEENDEEQYEENEVGTLLMSAQYSLDPEAGHSRQGSRRESPVRDDERDDEREDERDDEEDDEEDNERDDERLHYRDHERCANWVYREVQREPERGFSEENEGSIYEEPESEVDRNVQRELEGRGSEESDFQENEGNIYEELERQANEILQREVEREFGNNVDWSFNSLRNRGQARRPMLNDPRTMAQRYAAVVPTSFGSPLMFCPTLYNRRYPYRYEEFVNRYMSINNNEKIPDETATAWLEMIYHEIESLLNYVDRIGKFESYQIIMAKVENRYLNKFPFL